MKDLTNKPINKIRFKTKKKDYIEFILSLTNETGNTEVEIEIDDNETKLIFKLKNKRNIDRSMLKSLKKDHISTIIN